jgi:biotin operon repressor
MKHAGVIPTLRSKYETLQPFLNERVRRLWSATEAMGLGHGGIAALAEATGMSRTTISAAIQEIQDLRESPGSRLPVQRSRRPGTGRKRLIEQDPALLTTLELLVDPTTRGDPMSPLRWTCKSTRKLAEQLRQYGYQVSERTVAHLLHQLNYSLQGNRKAREGESHPDRDAQFEYINAQVVEFQQRRQPVVSVDTKKTAMWGIGRTRVSQQCTDGPCPVNLTVCSVAQDHRPPGGHLCQLTDHVSPFWYIRGATPHSPIRRWWSDRAPRFLTALRLKELTTLYGPLGRTAR